METLSGMETRGNVEWNGNVVETTSGIETRGNVEWNGNAWKR